VLSTQQIAEKMNADVCISYLSSFSRTTLNTKRK
jgi:hypothetical protein